MHAASIHISHIWLGLIRPEKKYIHLIVKCYSKKFNSIVFFQGGLGKINIPLLSDLNHKIAKDYGVYLDDLGHSLRGLFIIDHRGILRQITMNDLPVGRSVDETLRLVQAFQYTDSHGEVCPAGWRPGADTVSIAMISLCSVANILLFFRRSFQIQRRK